MIVRISSEGQYRLQSAHLDRLNELDNAIVETVAKGDEGEFHRLFAELLAFIRQNGERLPDTALEGSDVILPPPDTTLAEARELFRGEGVLPG